MTDEDPTATTDSTRFWSKVDKSGECWLWTAYIKENGYGQFWCNGTNSTAHRWAYIEANGPVLADNEVDHRATCPRHCVRPSHLREVSTKQNQENLRGPHVDARTGVLNVTWEESRKRYRVTVRHHGVDHFGGRFRDLADAEKAAKSLRNRLFTHNDMDRAISA